MSTHTFFSLWVPSPVATVCGWTGGIWAAVSKTWRWKRNCCAGQKHSTCACSDWPWAGAKRSSELGRWKSMRFEGARYVFHRWWTKSLCVLDVHVFHACCSDLVYVSLAALQMVQEHMGESWAFVTSSCTAWHLRWRDSSGLWQTAGGYKQHETKHDWTGISARYGFRWHRCHSLCCGGNGWLCQDDRIESWTETLHVHNVRTRA